METTPLSQQKEAIERLTDPSLSLTDTLAEAGFDKVDGETRLSMIEQATLDDYMTAVDTIHQKVAPGHDGQIHPTPMKVHSKLTGEYTEAASPVERVDIMDHALRNAKLVVQKYRTEGGSLKDALQRGGNLLAFGVVLAHNYSDRNGGTARVLGELIHNGFDSSNPESAQDLQLFSAERSTLKGFRPHSYIPRFDGPWGDGRANQDPMGFLDVVASLEQPLDEVSYHRATEPEFTTASIVSRV